MRKLSVRPCLALIASLVVASLGFAPFAAHAQPTDNLLPNGGFEDGQQAWMWEQWAAKPLPGYIDRDDMADGLASFKLTLPDASGQRYMAAEAKGIDSSKPHVLSFSLKTEDVPQGAARVRLQVPGRGWLHTEGQLPDLVSTGGTTDGWQDYVFPVPADKLGDAGKVTVFFYHDKIGQGVLGIDDVIVRPVGQGESVEKQVPAGGQGGDVDEPTQQEPAPAAEPEAADDGDVPNGGFESGSAQGWMYEQWAGKPLPGEVVREDAPQGDAWFRFGDADGSGERYLAKEIAIPDPSKDWRLTYRIKTDGVPDNAARVRLQIPGKGWLHTPQRYPDQLKTGGTTDWQTHTIDLPADALGGKSKATLFIYHDRVDEGTIGIDDVRLEPAGAASSAASRQGRAGPRPSGSLDAVSFDPADPCVLVPTRDALVAIRVEPDAAVYHATPTVRIDRVADAEADLTWSVRDGFGETIASSNVASAEGQSIDVTLPDGHGYYEIVAELRRGDRSIASARRSVGVVPQPASGDSDEPFGLWIQGREHYDELGVNWVREGLSMAKFESDPQGAIAYYKDMVEGYRERGIKVMLYPKGQPSRYRIDRELMEDTPEAWAALEAHWTRLVEAFAGQADVWGVINEPMSTFWKGDNDMVMEYWRLFRRIVDEHDPDTPLIGPSLNPMTPKHVAQYDDLLERGFGELIDGIEVHPYTSSPDDNDMVAATRRFQEMTREATGKWLPVYVTELGLSATYPLELHQANFTARSWLLCKQAGYPMVIWHMFSWPQGMSDREVNFGTFRNVKNPGAASPQARPAGVTFAVMAKKLHGARYAGRLEHLGPSIHALLFERDGRGPMLALWTTSKRDFPVQFAVDGQPVNRTDIFGRATPIEPADGLIDVTVTDSPVLLGPMPAHYLDAEPPARLAGPVDILPGRSASQALHVANPTAAPAELRVEWLGRHGYAVDSDTTRWSLPAGASAQARVTVDAPDDAEVGTRQLFGKVYLDGKYVQALRVPVAVEPPVKIVGLRPAYHHGRPAVAIDLERVADAFASTTVTLADGSADAEVSFDGQSTVTAYLPVPDASATALREFEVVASAAGVSSRESAQLSFAAATRMPSTPSIDGRLEDWPGGHAIELVSDDDSATIRWAWDADHLYLAVQVDDATHLQDRPPHMTWEQDSLQIGLAPRTLDQLIRPYNVGLQEAEMTGMDLALGDSGPTLYRHRTMNKLVAPNGQVSPGDMSHAVRRGDGVTVYELAVPVDKLGFKPFERGDVLRAALLINNADEHVEGLAAGRSTTVWFKGIARSKDPDDFGHLVLVDR